MPKGRTKKKSPDSAPKPLGTYRARPYERTLEQRREDVEAIAELFLRGHTCAEIARILNGRRDRQTTVATVSADLKRVHTIWAEQVGGTLASSRNRILAELNAIRRAAWDGYECSKKTVETRQRMLSVGGNSEPPSKEGAEDTPKPESTDRVTRDQVRVTKEQVPDIKFLDTILEVNKRECEILGLTSEINMNFLAAEAAPKQEEKALPVSEERMAEWFRKRTDYAAQIVEAELVRQDVPPIATPPKPS